MTPGKRTELALEYAFRSVRGMTTIAATLMGVFVAAHQHIGGCLWVLVVSLGLFLVATVCGVLTEMAIAGQASPTGDSSPDEPSIYAPAVISTWKVQSGAWGLGFVALIVYCCTT